MSNCPHRRPAGIVNSSVDENEACAQCALEVVESAAYWKGVKHTLYVVAVAVALIWWLA